MTMVVLVHSNGAIDVYADMPGDVVIARCESDSVDVNWYAVDAMENLPGAVRTAIDESED